VRFAGFLNQSRMAEAYAMADVLIVPAAETWGLVVNEAMSCGLPCFVSDAVGSGPDLVASGETGEVFPLGDTAALAARLVALARDRERARRMGRQARERVEAFSFRAATEGLREAVAAVLS